MFEVHEILTLILGLGTAVFIAVFQRRLRRWPGGGWLLVGFAAALVSWIFGVVETVWLPRFCNTLEHLGFGVAAVGLFLFLLRGSEG